MESPTISALAATCSFLKTTLSGMFLHLRTEALSYIHHASTRTSAVFLLLLARIRPGVDDETRWTT